MASSSPRLIPPHLVQTASLIAKAYTNKQIGAALGKSDRTVRLYVERLEAELRLPSDKDSRVLITRWWIEHVQRAA